MIELPPQNYDLASIALETVAINTLFAESVANRTRFGHIYVDQLSSPSCFYIKNPCGMSLLFGQTDHKEFNHALFDYMTNKNKVRKECERLQVYPNS